MIEVINQKPVTPKFQNLLNSGNVIKITAILGLAID
jgi:hypothetical protein